MNTQQQQTTNQIEPTSCIIEFEIETLEGKVLSVSITKSEAEKVHMTNANIKHAWEPQAFHKYQGYWTVHTDNTFTANTNPYESYGLDFLKAAISNQNGADPITMQLFTSDDELTTATPLLPLQNQVLSLIIKSPITVTLQHSQPLLEWRRLVYALEHNIDFLKGSHPQTAPTICYIHSPETSPPPPTTIQAVGLDRDYFKISIENLPFHLLRDSHWLYAEHFSLDGIHIYERPNHLWLRFDKNVMTYD